MRRLAEMWPQAWRVGEKLPWLSPWLCAVIAAVLCIGGAVLMAGMLGSQKRSGPVFNAYQQGCVLASPILLPVDQIVKQRDDFQCDEPSIPSETKQLWLRIPMSQSGLEAEELNLEGDSAPVESLQIVHQNADGEMSVRMLKSDQIIEYWTAGTRYSIPLTADEARSTTMWLGVNRPWSRLAINSVEIMSRDQAQGERFDRSIWFAIYGGLGIVPIIYSLAFLIALRYRFMAWHAAMASSFVLYTFSSSSLILQFIPSLGMWPRTLLSYCSLSLAVAFGGYFLLRFLEEDAVPPWVERATAWASHILIANAVFIVTLGPQLPFIGRNIYHMAYGPAIIMYMVCCAVALSNKSRAVWFLICGWSLTSIAAVDRIFRGLDIYIMPAEIDFSLYPCLAMEVIVTAGGVAFRVMSIRQQRDHAIMREREFAHQASTDLLTGLGNRRQFDQHFALATEDALALIDIDNFKRVNDNYGHQTGDEVLRILGRELKSFVAENWCKGAYRLGGEEFAVLLAVQGDDAAAMCCEQIRARIEKTLSAKAASLNEPVTISMGIAMTHGVSGHAAFRNADAALYHAKAQGRNRVAIAGKSTENSVDSSLRMAIKDTAAGRA